MILLFLFLISTQAINPPSYYPVLQQLDSLWQLNFTNTFGDSTLACNCSGPCLWKNGFDGFTCQAGILTIISFTSNLPGIIPTEIGLLTSLTTLTLQNTNLGGNIPIELNNLNLNGLYLSNNRFTGNLPSLNSKILYVDNNQLSGNLPVLPNIEQLKINNNYFTGGLVNLENKNLQACDISFNLFGGLFPNLNWTALTSLNIQNNSFIGPIPNGLSLSSFAPGSCNLNLNYFENCNISPISSNVNCVTSCKISVCPGNPPAIGAICVNGQWQLVGNIVIDNLDVDSVILITGNLTLENDSQLIVNGEGLIIVTGSVVVGGNLKLEINNTNSQVIINADNISGEFDNIELSLDRCFEGEGVNTGNTFTVFILDKCTKTSRKIIIAATISSFIFLALIVIVISLIVYRYRPDKMHIVDRTETELPRWR